VSYEHEYKINKQGETQRGRFPELHDGSYVSGSSVLADIMNRIQPDGYVNLPNQKRYKSFSEPPIDFARLTPQEVGDLQLSYANMLYSYITDIYWPAVSSGNKAALDRRDRHEPSLAVHFSRIRHQPEFIIDIARIVDEVIEDHHVRPPDPTRPKRHPTIR